MRVSVRVGWVLTVAAALATACAPAGSSTQNGGQTGPAAPAQPKTIVAVSSGNPPGLDNRFVVTSNNANRVAVPLYASTLILSDASSGLQRPQLAESIPSVD